MEKVLRDESPTTRFSFRNFQVYVGTVSFLFRCFRSSSQREDDITCFRFQTIKLPLILYSVNDTLDIVFFSGSSLPPTIPDLTEGVF